MAELKAITFDFWNTLVIQDLAAGRDLRKSMLLKTLTENGYSIHPSLVDAGFDVVAHGFQSAWRAGDQFLLADGVEVFRNAIGADPRHDAQLAATWFRWGEEIDLQLVEENLGETLAAISAAGVAIGIICDVGLMASSVLLGHLERLGIRQYFHHWSFSDDVGFYKPAPEIFAHSHAGLGVVDPATALHIGDLRRTDVGGARSFGSATARYRGVVDDVAGGDDSDPADGDLPDADHVVTSHAELLALI